MNPSALNAVDPLRLNACPACRYSLEGLGETGACPECGRAFDRAAVVLYGYGRGPFAHAGNARPWVALWLLIIPLFQLVNLRSRRVLLLFTLLWVGSVVWMLARRWRTDAPGLAQVHLAAEGCRQFDAANAERALAAPPTPWAKIDRVIVEPVWENRVRIKLAERTRSWQLERVRVDVEIPGGPEFLAALSARVRAWHDAAHANDPTGGFPVVPLKQR
jgi:hypothetical protein